jgi:hypothetical protein
MNYLILLPTTSIFAISSSSEEESMYRLIVRDMISLQRIGDGTSINHSNELFD